MQFRKQGQFRSKDSLENKGSSESNGSLDIRTVQKTRNGFASVTRAVKKQVKGHISLSVKQTGQ